MIPKEKVTEFLEKLKTAEPGKANMIIVSGIPGCGKHKLAESLFTMLKNEGVHSKVFKMGLAD